MLNGKTIGKILGEIDAAIPSNRQWNRGGNTGLLCLAVAISDFAEAITRMAGAMVDVAGRPPEPRRSPAADRFAVLIESHKAAHRQFQMCSDGEPKAKAAAIESGARIFAEIEKGLKIEETNQSPGVPREPESDGPA